MLLDFLCRVKHILGAGNAGRGKDTVTSWLTLLICGSSELAIIVLVQGSRRESPL